MARKHVSTEDEMKAYRRISNELGLKLMHQRLQVFNAMMLTKVVWRRTPSNRSR